jgi:hypothetical protein
VNYDLPKLREIALVLENDGDFHSRYKPSSRHGSRRERIDRAAVREGFKTTQAEREQLRRYFDKLWNMPAPDTDDISAEMSALPTLDIHTDNTPEPQPKPTDYSALPDGTRFRLVNGKVVTKGVY